jgi:Cytochrome c554 and c-prime
MSSVQRAVLAAAGVGLIGFGAVFSQNGSTEPRPAVARDDKPAETIGMAGCAATGCHGRTNVRHGTLDADTWHESFALWLDRDPHTRSYAVLTGTLAKQMMKRLHQGDPSIPEDATRDLRCLACHTNPSLAKPIEDASGQLQRIRAEGVSCEACHGNAEHWQIAHTNPIPPDQRKNTLAQWQMNDLNDWRVQAATCAGCHVGAPEDAKRGIPVRDMNHDMIAAGHPRLEFDFTTYQAKLAKHWQPRDRTTGQKHTADAMLLAWANGQLAVEAAYCELSLDRMARGNVAERSPYPEFADWNCSHCHHQLAGAGWREEAAKKQSGSRGLGRPGWIGASAYLPAAPAPTFGEKRDLQKTKLDERLKRIAAHASTLKNPADARRVIGEFLAAPSVVPANWEEATRDYLGLRSLEIALRGAGGAPANETLARLADARKAFWGSPDEPARKEHAFNDYQRKPESRWIWERKTEARDAHPIDATLRALRESLAKDLQKLPAANSKP